MFCRQATGGKHLINFREISLFFSKHTKIELPVNSSIAISNVLLKIFSLSLSLSLG
jgi:hypothetical protein